MATVVPFPGSVPPTEWVGGRHTFALGLPDRNGAVYNPEVVVWIEVPSLAVVWTTIVDPKKAVGLADALELGLKLRPDGRPARIRVSDAAAAESLREAAGDIPVVVGPVPELDVFFGVFNDQSKKGSQLSYLNGGTISAEVVADFFSAASDLYRAAPWRHARVNQYMLMDIPALRIERASLSLTANSAMQGLGMLVFPSREHFRSFYDQSGERTRTTADHIAAQALVREVSMRSLAFDARKDVAPLMAREIEEHQWPVAGPDAHPILLTADADLFVIPATERDYRIVTAGARAAAAFVERHRRLFKHASSDPVRESFTDSAEGTVRITGPHVLASSKVAVAVDMAEPVATVRRSVAKTVGRNDPCPCGSGKKYKKCHLEADRAVTAPPPEAEPVYEIDYRLVEEIGQFAMRRFGGLWFGTLLNDVDYEQGDQAFLTLLTHWIAWKAVVDGKRVADWYLEEQADLVTPEEGEWAAAQRGTWLSVWEVTGVVPPAIELRDLLTGERRTVQEEAPSRIVRPGDAVLATVVEFRGAFVFGGLYVRPLPVEEVTEVIRKVRSKVRARKGSGVPIERLQSPPIGRFLLDRWQEAMDDHDSRRSAPP